MSSKHVAIESSPKHQALTQLLICTGSNCGGPQIERVPKQALLAAWKADYLWKACHLSFSQCLGPCHLKGNTLVLHGGGATWLAELEGEDYLLLADWAAACKRERRVLNLPPQLATHILERFAEPEMLNFERQTSSKTL
ncbi:hypothetical protein [Deinococcus arenicola]|uniref:(2Fe-2S) ferredoxin domain-containing protein n=1 Tax=Deinococcus arenicola TaxID=2994950 RepID=A0ABU4DTM7_9DEIO|nr:hypothetical protein [Deinococcus sp. ZS9-10]MDV6375733.1 hypothetical protein [Deinococcus sp. ZS9-10]